MVRACLLGVALLAGCGAAVDEPVEVASAAFYVDAAAPTRAQAAELAAIPDLQEAAFRPATHDLEFLRAPHLVSAQGDPARAAMAFVAAHPALFLGAQFRADDVHRVGADVVVHASQIADGRRVLEGALAFAFDAAGNLVQIAGSERAVRPVPPPKIDDSVAVARATELLVRALPGTTPLFVESEPVIANGRGAYRIVVEANPRSGPTRRSMLIDDQDQSLLGDVEELRFVQGSGIDVFGKRRALDVSELEPGRFALVDATRGRGIATFDAAAGGFPGQLVTSTDPMLWDAHGAAAGAAVDAHANAEAVFDFYERAFGRDGVDGHGAGLTSAVHFGAHFTRAFWDGAELVFGDGDGSGFAPLPAALDIVAHEATHAVTQFTANPDPAGESGALDEALADAFASFAELETGHGDQAWQIGSTIYAPGGEPSPLRDLADPGRLGAPDHMSQYRAAPPDAAHDDGEVHANSTIVGHAIYLIAEGGTDPVSGRSARGIGAARAEQVVYRAMTHGLSRHADFAQLARASISAAGELYGPGDADAVRGAWQAVGVLVPADEVVPTHDAGGRDREPNDEQRLASPIELGESISGEISDAADLDTFRFQLPAAREVTLVLSGLSSDLDLRVYDPAGRIVARSEQAGTVVEEIRARARAGAFYVRVSATEGSEPRHAAYHLTLE